MANILIARLEYFYEGRRPKFWKKPNKGYVDDLDIDKEKGK